MAALRAQGLYRYSEPNLATSRFGFPSDPGTFLQWAPAALRLTSLTPPFVPPDGPLLAVIEDTFGSAPEYEGTSTYTVGHFTVDWHGVAVASVAAAPANGRGIVGAYPGARVLISGARPTCGGAVEAIEAALHWKARIINMSYGFDGPCFTHQIATNLAYGRGATLVAAAGNEGDVGLRTYMSPASDPHVITVAATAPGDESPTFSNANQAIDVAAPGVGVLAAVPPDHDPDGRRDGYAFVDGTSFSAPLVAAGATWVLTERPSLDQTQLTDLLRYSVRDAGPPGWDPYFGFGAFELPPGLTRRAPLSDPLEPNEDVQWINGRRFVGADPPIHRGYGVTRFRATVDRFEDPTDVYRIVQPPYSRTRFRLRPLYGDPDLELYAGWARSVYGRRGRIGGSYRSGLREDGGTLTNRFGRRLVAWVVVFPASRRVFDAGYRLEIRRGA